MNGRGRGRPARAAYPSPKPGLKSFDLKSCKEYVEKEEVISDKIRGLAELQQGAAGLFKKLKGMSLEQLLTFLRSKELKGLDKGKFTLAKKWVMEEEESRRSDSIVSKIFKHIDIGEIFENDEDFLHDEFSLGGFLANHIGCLQSYNKLILDKLKGINSKSQFPPTPPSTSRSDETGSSDGDDSPDPLPLGRRSVNRTMSRPKETPMPSPNGVDRSGGPTNSLVECVKEPSRPRVKKTQMIASKKIESPRATTAVRPKPPNLSPSPTTRSASKSPPKRPRILVSSPPTERSTRATVVEPPPSEPTCLIYPNQQPKGRFLYRYNWQTKRQEQLYKIETPREYSCCIGVGDRLYDLGGTETKHRPNFGDASEGSNIVEIFRIGEERNRSRGPSMLEKRKEFSACVVDDFLYVVGGCCKDEAYNSCEKLNIRNSDSEWIEMTHFLNVPRGAHTTAVIGKQIFAIGGIGAEHERTVEVYDTETPGRWNYTTRMISPRGRHGTVVFNNLIYAIGGEDADELPLRTAEYFDPGRDRWIQMPPMRHGRRELGVCVYDGLVLALGGVDEQPSLPLIEAYDPRIGAWEVIQGESGLHPMGKFYNAISN